MPPITSWTVYNTNYCTHYLSGTAFESCDQWTTISWLTKSDYKEVGTAILFNGGVMIAMVMVVLYLLKWIFSKFFW